MNKEQLYALMDGSSPKVSLLLIGKHGVGKSEIIEEYAKSRNKKFISIVLSQRTEGDFVGIPLKKEIEGKIYSSFAPPDMFAEISQGEGIMCLDELPDALPDIRNAAQELIQARRLNGVRVGDGWRFVACGNPATTLAYCTGDLRPQMVGRFLKINFQPSHREWVKYAEKTNHHRAVVSFIATYSKWLFPPDELEMNLQYPSPRQWTRMSEILGANSKFLDQDMLFEIACGCVGVPVGSLFSKYVEENFKIATAEEILSGNFKNVVYSDVPALSNVIGDLVRFRVKILKENEFKNLKSFLNDCPREIKASYIRKYVKFHVSKDKESGATLMELTKTFYEGVPSLFETSDILRLDDGR